MSFKVIEGESEIVNQEEHLCKVTEELTHHLSTIQVSPPISVIYNPLEYAKNPYVTYVKRYGQGTKRVLFLGMNPGPWGMAQTGIPFGEVNHVKEWLKIIDKVEYPKTVHPKRPVHGFSCSRSEVSGKRVWGLMREKFVTPDQFFRDHFIANYCPLLFFDWSGKNITPDKLKKADRKAVFEACDRHLVSLIDIFKPSFLVGFGKFAEKQLHELLDKGSSRFTKNCDIVETHHLESIRVLSIPHPSPANPRANRGWAKIASDILEQNGVW